MAKQETLFGRVELLIIYERTQRNLRRDIYLSLRHSGGSFLFPELCPFTLSILERATASNLLI